MAIDLTDEAPVATFVDTDHVNPLTPVRMYVLDYPEGDLRSSTGDTVLVHDGTVYIEEPASTGVHRIAAERARQVQALGWDDDHDDNHDDGAIAWAAVCYAAPWKLGWVEEINPPPSADGPDARDPWPWDPEWDKRTHGPDQTREQRIRDLTKAGALIAAEIDRLLREQARE